MKTILISAIVAFSFLLSPSSFSQVPEIDWETSIGGGNDDIGYVLQLLPGGDFLVVGSTFSDDFDITEHYDGDDAWIERRNTAGGLVWGKTFGGTESDAATDVVIASDGNLITTGVSFSDDIDLTENKGERDFWIFKFTTSGDLIWSKSYGGSSIDIARSVEKTDDGGCIVVGYIGSDDGDISNPLGGWDIWVLKLDSNGDLEWERTYGGSGSDKAFSVQKTAEGYLIAGNSSSVDGDVLENNGNLDVVVLKIDEDGNVLWTISKGGSQEDSAEEIIETNSGNFVICGYSYSEDFDVTDHHGAADKSDCWIFEMDPTGNILWQLSVGGGSTDVGMDIVQKADGTFLAGGYSRSSNGDIVDNIGGFDYIVCNIDQLGNLLWVGNYGGTADDELRGIMITETGSFMAIGNTRSDDVDVTGHYLGIYDMWLFESVSDGCLMPTDIYADNIATTKATIHWTAAPDLELNQVWYRTTAGGPWIKKTSLTDFKTIKALTPGTTYEYKVRTKCTDGEFSEFSPIESFTTLPLKTGEMENDLSIEVYPNPASDLLYVELDRGDHDIELKILDMAGKQIKSISTNNSELIEINIAELSSGIYLLVMSHATNAGVIKFIKQ